MAYEDRTLAGKCLCGAVHYAVPDEFVYALNCHCSNCRRATGSAFKPFAGIERSKLRITRGEANLLVYGGERAFDAHCNLCGSFLYSVVRDGKYAHIVWAPWSTVRASAPRHTSLSAPRRRGSPSPMTCRNTMGMSATAER